MRRGSVGVFGVAAGAAVLAVAVGASPVAGQDYEGLWAAGVPYEEFRDGVEARRSLWERNTERAQVPASLLERARSVPGSWRLLVVATDRCSDSVSTLPYIAALVERVDGLALRIVPPDEGRAVMAAYRTPDGRSATPTVVLLDDAGRPAGAWVERPSELQSWFNRNPDGLSHDERYFQKMAWYARDAGVSTVEEVVELLVNQVSRERGTQ
ncbi:MAG: thioredoxin family protein [Longimicrobiales bacterium]|nr:thioredoxin family protein [Longimicrobiales bacterium]